MFNATIEGSIRVNDEIPQDSNDLQSSADNSPPRAKKSSQNTTDLLLTLVLHYIIPMFVFYMLFLAILRWRKRRELQANFFIGERGSDDSYRDALQGTSDEGYVSRDLYRSNLSSMLLTKKVLDQNDATTTSQHNMTGSKENIYVDTCQNDSDKSCNNDDMICNICLSGYSVGEEICYSRNPSCSHMFHKECILEWLIQQNDCPNCREQFLDPTFDDNSVAPGNCENNNQVFSHGDSNGRHNVPESHESSFTITPTHDVGNLEDQMSYMTPAVSEDTFDTAPETHNETSTPTRTPVFATNYISRANIEEYGDFEGSDNIKPNEFDNISLVSLPISSITSMEESKCSFELFDERLYSSIHISQSPDSTIDSRLTHESLFQDNAAGIKSILGPIPYLSDENSVLDVSLSEDFINTNNTLTQTNGNDQHKTLFESSELLLIPPICHKLGNYNFVPKKNENDKIRESPENQILFSSNKVLTEHTLDNKSTSKENRNGLYEQSITREKSSSSRGEEPDTVVKNYNAQHMVKHTDIEKGGNSMKSEKHVDIRHQKSLPTINDESITCKCIVHNTSRLQSFNSEQRDDDFDYRCRDCRSYQSITGSRDENVEKTSFSKNYTRENFGTIENV